MNCANRTNPPTGNGKLAACVRTLLLLIVTSLYSCNSASDDASSSAREALARAESSTLAVRSVRVVLTRTRNNIEDRHAAEGTLQAPDRLSLERNGERSIFIKDKAYVALPTGLFEVVDLDNSNPTGELWHFPVPELGNMARDATSISRNGGEYLATLTRSDMSGPRLFRVFVSDGLISRVVIDEGASVDTYDLNMFNSAAPVLQPDSRVVRSAGLCGSVPPSPKLGSSRRCASF